MELFGTAGIRGDVVERVTPELALAVGRAAGRDGDEFALGHDGRVSSPALADALAAGLESAGTDVVRIGAVPTPALAYASRNRRGAMVTASHNPPADNGIKLFDDGEEYDGEAEATVERRVEADAAATQWGEWGRSAGADVLPEYRAAVAEYARGFGADPDDLTVAVDCGNGMAGVATPQVLRALGAGVVATEANVDGYFPSRESKPTPESLAKFRSFVAASDAAFGFGHDGDADRIVVVDGDGEVIHEDTVLAMLAEHYTRAADAGDPVVVTTPNASGRIDERVTAAGGRVERVHLGALHEGIARERAAGGDETAIVFAAEPWKHVHTAFSGWIDGVASAAVLTRLFAAESLAERRAVVTERPYRKVSVECPDDRKADAMATVGETLPEAFPAAEVSTEYGVRLSFPDDSWTLVRPSGTEPYVRVYAESDDVDALVEEVRAVVASAIDSAGDE
ncbi:phosphomannomutase [Halomicroarcula sp. F13]|uniref:Phosphomannomutase n=1 Tax=Haloarcula rubra TaxID=2487747 RepID=A0AAW4PRS2_9EURY|nr:phosphomannomutase [Halomicroarcula rubra]MBX0323098.1 phosphomannomutase [Halomicroarcula rubra]